ncbi:slipin family protein [Nocardioides panacihumi]|uniref:Slipin family protein n=1 Tax=Nocardioides panacihumi TaxID=400774 RepID=A0ABN2RSF6_9ACTN
MDVVLIILVIVVLLAGLLFAGSARVVKQIERGVVFRLGRVLPDVRQPGLTALIPVVDRLRRVNMQVVTMTVPAQDGITRDNVTVRVDAVVYYRVIDPVLAVVQVQDYAYAISQVAQTSLRSIIGKSELDDLLCNREHLNQGLEIMLDSPALPWGIEIDRVEIKDVALPETMKRSMSRQAEAERERRSRIITADGEFQASKKLAEAAHAMSATPAALQLRLLQTMVEVAAEKNSTLVLPFPVEMLRYFEAVATGEPAPVRRSVQTAAEPPAEPPAGEAVDEAVDGALPAFTDPPPFEVPIEVPIEQNGR